jgi:hypothetical protein
MMPPKSQSGNTRSNHVIGMPIILDVAFATAEIFNARRQSMLSEFYEQQGKSLMSPRHPITFMLINWSASSIFILILIIIPEGRGQLPID